MCIRDSFLNASITEELYVQQPQGFSKDGRACRLLKSLYGLKQAARAWHERLAEQLSSGGLFASSTESTLYCGTLQQGWVGVLVYVDDLLLVGTKPAIDTVLGNLSSAFTLTQEGTLGDGETGPSVPKGHRVPWTVLLIRLHHTVWLQ